MAQVSSIFSQLLGLVPRRLFDTAVARHGGMRHARGFACWDQFVAMMFCQLGQAHSLREIREGLQSCEGPFDNEIQVDKYTFATGHPSFVMSNSFANQTHVLIDRWKKKDAY